MNDLALPNIANMNGMSALKDLGLDSQGDLKDLNIRDVKVRDSAPPDCHTGIHPCTPIN